LKSLTWPPLLQALVAPAWWLTAPMFAESAKALVVRGRSDARRDRSTARDRPALEGPIRESALERPS
jgi:hypothetical protein